MKNIKRIIVTDSAKSYHKTRDIINNAKSKLNITNIIYLNNDKPTFPAGSTDQQKLEYMKETLVITTRKSTPFITTFASPGKIVEDLGTLLILGWHCSYNCNFCYLLKSMLRRQWQEVYVNLEKLEKEIVFEKYVHPAILTLWSLYSEFKSEKQLKIPKNFKDTADWLRVRFIQESIDTDKKAIDFMKKNFLKLFYKLGEDKLKGHIRKLRGKISEFYDANKKFKPWLNVSEYTDFFAIDLITDFSSDIIKILQNNPEIQISGRTKSSNVDNFLTFNATDNVKLAINFNTQYAIDNFEIGTASLDERIESAKKIQNRNGFLLKVVIEPIMVYPNYESDYLQLVERLKTELDLTKVVDISFGGVRYSTKHVNLINKVYPKNKLDLSSKNLVYFPKDRIRYSEMIREDLYKKIKKSFNRRKGLTLRLAAETPAMWDKVGLDKEAHIAKSVVQYGKGD